MVPRPISTNMNHFTYGRIEVLDKTVSLWICTLEKENLIEIVQSGVIKFSAIFEVDSKSGIEILEV